MFQTIKKTDVQTANLIAEYFANGGKVTYCKTGARSNDGMFDQAQWPTKAQRAAKKTANSKTAKKGK